MTCLGYPGNIYFRYDPTSFLGLLALLNGFSCAEVSTSVKPINLEDLSPVLLHEISSYLRIPFRILSIWTSISEIYSQNLHSQACFQWSFQYSELVTDDIKDNEGELQLLLKYSVCQRTRSRLSSFWSEFLEGNTLSVIIPHLVKYFNRYITHWTKKIHNIKLAKFYWSTKSLITWSSWGYFPFQLWNYRSWGYQGPKNVL